MKRINLLFMFVVLSLVGIVYNEFKRKYLDDDDNDQYNIGKEVFTQRHR